MIIEILSILFLPIKYFILYFLLKYFCQVYNWSFFSNITHRNYYVRSKIHLSNITCAHNENCGDLSLNCVPRWYLINTWLNRKKLCPSLAGYLLFSSIFLTCSIFQSNAALFSGLLAHYRSLVDQGKLQHDPYQEKVASELENLLGRLEQYEKDMEEYHVSFI